MRFLIVLITIGCATPVPQESMDLCTRICAGKPAVVDANNNTVRCKCHP